MLRKTPETKTKLAVVCDLSEENWPSMDLAAETLATSVRGMAGRPLEVSLLRPQMRRRFTNAAGNDGGWRFNADRLANRFWDYPRWLRKRRNDFTLFHLADHSYAQLVHELPAARTLVTCHDLDTFHCLLNPPQEARSPVFRRLVRHTLHGLQKAARVICDSETTQAALLATGWIAPERVRVVPLPVHPVFFSKPTPEAERSAVQLLGPDDGSQVDLLHVGSHIARKRLDVLLRVFAEVKQAWPAARLVRVGGEMTAEQQALAVQLGVAQAVLTLPPLPREVLAAVYYRAALTLLPSEREGFGWPVAESLVCGVPVVASDLPVLREVGGTATEYAPVAAVPEWAQLIRQLLQERQSRTALWTARREHARNYAKRFSCESYAQNLWIIYKELLAL